MLEDIIKHLTATKNYEHITSGGILAWAKRVEVQRAQAGVLNTMIKSKQFDKIKISKKAKDDKARHPVNQTTQCWGESTSQGSAHCMARCVWSAVR